MSWEKKHWRLSTPFRRLSGRQDLQLKGGSGSHVSSVYLSDDSSANNFVVVPEFDDPVRTQTTQEGSNHSSHLSRLSGVTSSNPPSPNSYFCDLEPIGFQFSSYLVGGSRNNSVASTSWDDDLSQRLYLAYQHIRSMTSAVSPKVSLSSDPQILRKQLGVPQHSVLNYPIHSSLDLPNPHTPPFERTSPRLSPAASLDASPATTSKKFGSRIDTNVYPDSPRHGFPAPSKPTQRTHNPGPVVTAPLQCSTAGAPSSAHIARKPKPQTSISNPSKLVKRRVEKPIAPLSSRPFARRQALRSVLRKPAADTPPSKPHNWWISLPQIKPPSPFKVDIVSFLTIRYSTCNAVTPSSPFIIPGTTAEPILALLPSVTPR